MVESIIRFVPDVPVTNKERLNWIDTIEAQRGTIYRVHRGNPRLGRLH